MFFKFRDNFSHPRDQDRNTEKYKTFHATLSMFCLFHQATLKLYFPLSPSRAHLQWLEDLSIGKTFQRFYYVPTVPSWGLRL
jgi:hypothetical protein